MKVRLLEISEKPSQFTFQAARKDLGKIEERFQFEYLACEALLTWNREFVELKGHYRVRVETTCDLCLNQVVLDLDEGFRVDLVAEDDLQAPVGDLELSMDSPELDYYQGEEIFLPRYFEDQLILDLPLVIKCSETCKGLCSVCGVNLNHHQCDCPDDAENSPFSILKDLKPDS